jgi:hypothetical protein
MLEVRQLTIPEANVCARFHPAESQCWLTFHGERLLPAAVCSLVYHDIVSEKQNRDYHQKDLQLWREMLKPVIQDGLGVVTSYRQNRSDCVLRTSGA